MSAARLIMQGLAVCAALCVFGGSADASEIKLLASNAVKEAYGLLLPAFEKASGNKVTVVWGGTADIIRRIEGGEPADIVIITDAGIDRLIGAGKLTAMGRVTVAKSGVGAAVRAGGSKPDLSSGDALKKSLLAAKAIVLTPGPSNPLLHQLFDRMGLAKEMKAKEIRPMPGQQLTDPVIAGKADIVFSQTSELIAVKGIEYAGPLPSGSQIVLTYDAAFHAGAPQPGAAKDLVKFLTTPAAARMLQQNGLEPG
ncbi:MAG TPA: substrate-binding domain-containing protein [Micropepsaceae bacterium]|jgi:molybdate transport system substrate-binding protein